MRAETKNHVTFTTNSSSRHDLDIRGPSNLLNPVGKVMHALIGLVDDISCPCQLIWLLYYALMLLFLIPGSNEQAGLSYAVMRD